MTRNAVSRWMWDRGITGKDIARETGASKASVSMTISGARNDSRVIEYLKLKGCPYLYIEMRNSQSKN